LGSDCNFKIHYKGLITTYIDKRKKNGNRNESNNEVSTKKTIVFGILAGTILKNRAISK